MMENSENDQVKGVERLKMPENIREAMYASSPYSLKKAFDNDPDVNRLIKAGEQTVPLIVKELESGGLELHEITLACYAYILQKVNPQTAARVLESLFAKAMEKPGPFFVNFAANSLREAAKLPAKSLGDTHSRAELVETLEAIRGRNTKERRV
ncbi:MAG: hypothetical protein ACE5OZ_25040 [Candidatus Heimdallarchaeota archaeon]